MAVSMDPYCDLNRTNSSCAAPRGEAAEREPRRELRRVVRAEHAVARVEVRAQAVALPAAADGVGRLGRHHQHLLGVLLRHRGKWAEYERTQPRVLHGAASRRRRAAVPAQTCASSLICLRQMWSAPDVLAHARQAGDLAADERHHRTRVGRSRAEVVGREAEIEQRRQVVPRCQLPRRMAGTMRCWVEREPARCAACAVSCARARRRHGARCNVASAWRVAWCMPMWAGPGADVGESRHRCGRE